MPVKVPYPVVCVSSVPGQFFVLSYEDWKPPGKAKKPKPRQKSPEDQFQEAKNRCFLLSQPMQGGGKINHIPIRTAAEAVVTPIQLHAWGFIVMERAASHPVPTYMDSIMLRSLSGCDGLLHSFKYIQIYPSLKIRKAPDIL